MSSIFERVEDHREPVLGGDRLGQRLRGHRVAARERAVERQPHQEHEDAEQPAAEHVGRVVPPERRAVGPDHEGEQHGSDVHRAPQDGLAHEHGREHDQHARERGTARRVAGGERLRGELRDGVLPGGPVAAVEQLDPGGEQRRRDHHPDGEDRGPAVPAHEQRYDDQDRPDGHPDRGEPDLDPAEEGVQARAARRPLMKGAPQVVEPVQGGALEVDQEGQQAEQRRTHPGPGQGHAAGAVEHGRQYAGRSGGKAHPHGRY